MHFLFLLLFTLNFPLFLASISRPELDKQLEEFFMPTEHTKNFAVLVSTSRNWTNYRHTVDVLSIYQRVRRLGVPDSNIVLMIPEVMACTKENSLKGIVLNDAKERKNLYTEDIELDYRGYDVTPENFIRVLSGLIPKEFPKNMHLLSDDQSNVLVYMTGHGGDGFLKFQDRERITNMDLANAIEFMFQKKRYKELFVIADTCQSASMYSEIYSPNVLATSSSLVGEDSLSHHVDRSIGVYIIDRYAYYVRKFLEDKVRSLDANVSMADYLASCTKEECISTVGVRTDLYPKPPAQVRVTDFFGARKYIQPLNGDYEFGEEWESLPTGSEERKKKWQF